MKTEIRKNGDTIIVSMTGVLDFETHVPLREDLSRIIRQTKTDTTAKIIFNLENLEFVGSSGISSFVQTLKEFNSSTTSKPAYCNVKSEFKRVIKAFDEQDQFQFYDNEHSAKKSFDC
jgi:anti-anti-sigma factor